METKSRTVSIQEILATRARATFSYRVNFDNLLRDNLEPMRQWCTEHCTGLWRCESYYALYFQFEEEKDATMFMLRWGTANGNKLK